LIFIAGIHGVGKTSFINRINKICQIEVYSASQLIADYKLKPFNMDKRVEEISDNQIILRNVLIQKDLINKKVLLDGHFCLLDSNDRIVRIPFETFVDLGLNAIVLLMEDVNIISLRRKSRDGIEIDKQLAKKFQNEELLFAKEVANRLGVPLFVSDGEINIESALSFVLSKL
jgi:adenylate kinase